MVVYIYYKFRQLAAGQLLSGQPVLYGKCRRYGPYITYKITPAGSLSSSQPGGLPCWASSLAFNLIALNIRPCSRGLILKVVFNRTFFFYAPGKSSLSTSRNLRRKKRISRSVHLNGEIHSRYIDRVRQEGVGSGTGLLLSVGQLPNFRLQNSKVANLYHILKYQNCNIFLLIYAQKVVVLISKAFKNYKIIEGVDFFPPAAETLAGLVDNFN
jgi:hypothetical protein